MRIAIFLSLLLAAAASNAHDYDGAVEVVVEANGDTRVGAHGQVSSSLPATIELGEDTKRQPSDAAPAKEKPTGVQEGTAARASLMVLQKELEVVETMLALQTQKMQMLKRMRTTLAEESDTSASLHALGFTRRQSTQTISQSDLEEAIDRKLDALTAQATTSASAAHFDSYFVERAILDLPNDVVDIKIDKIRAFPTQDIIAVGLRSGEVRIVLSSGHELLRIDTQVTELSGLQLDLASDPPLLVVFASGQHSCVRAYALHFDQKAKTSTDAQLASPSTDLVASQTALLSLRDSDSSIATVTAAAIARSPRRSVVGVARSNGTMTFYALNGSRIHDVSTGSSSVSVMATYRHLVAFASGTSAFIFPMSRSKVPEFQNCQGSLAPVSSIAFDPVYPDVVFTGTIDGEVLTFSLAANPDTQLFECKLVHRSIVHRGQSVEIAVFQGHVIAASSTQVTLFTVSRAGNEIKLNHVSSKVFEAPATRLATRLAVTENDHSIMMALVYVAPGSNTVSLLVLQSLLTAGSNPVDSSSAWRSMTTIGMVAIALLTAQYFLRRQQTSDKDSGRSEADQWRELLEKRRRDGPSSEFLGKGFSNNPSRSTPAAESTSEYMGDPTMFGATVDAFARAKNRNSRRGFEDQVDDPELRRKIAEARRQTLECTFDDDEGEDEY